MKCVHTGVATLSYGEIISPQSWRGGVGDGGGQSSSRNYFLCEIILLLSYSHCAAAFLLHLQCGVTCSICQSYHQSSAPRLHRRSLKSAGNLTFKPLQNDSDRVCVDASHLQTQSLPNRAKPGCRFRAFVARQEGLMRLVLFYHSVVTAALLPPGFF